MKILESLNEIDWGKNLALFALYIVIMCFCMTFYLFPIMEAHRIQTLDYKKTESFNAQIADSTNDLENNLRSLLSQNKQIYENMRNNVDMDELHEYASKYFSSVALEHISNTRENDIEKTTILINGTIKSVADIINFMENLHTLRNSVRLAMPINITKDDSGALAVGFAITFYTSGYAF